MKFPLEIGFEYEDFDLLYLNAYDGPFQPANTLWANIHGEQIYNDDKGINIWWIVRPKGAMLEKFLNMNSDGLYQKIMIGLCALWGSIDSEEWEKIHRQVAIMIKKKYNSPKGRNYHMCYSYIPIKTNIEDFFEEYGERLLVGSKKETKSKNIIKSEHKNVDKSSFMIYDDIWISFSEEEMKYINRRREFEYLASKNKKTTKNILNKYNSDELHDRNAEMIVLLAQTIRYGGDYLKNHKINSVNETELFRMMVSDGMDSSLATLNFGPEEGEKKLEKSLIITYAAQGMYDITCKMYDCIESILSREGVMDSLYPKAVQIIAERLYKNTVEMYIKKELSFRETVSRLCVCIKTNPYHMWYHAYLMKILSTEELEGLIKLQMLLFGTGDGLLEWAEVFEDDPSRIPGFN